MQWRCLNSSCNHEFYASISRREDDWASCPKCKSSARVVCQATPPDTDVYHVVAHGAVEGQSFELRAFFWRGRRDGPRFDLYVDGALSVGNCDPIHAVALVSEMIRAGATSLSPKAEGG